MESGDSLNVMNFVSTPIDEGLPIAPPASSPPSSPLLPNHVKAVAAEIEAYELSPFSTPTDEELVLNHLRPAIDRLKLPKGVSGMLPSRPAVVNAGLPVMNPWDLPGMSLMEEGRREKYYFTGHRDLCFTTTPLRASRFTNLELEAQDGFWMKSGQESLIKGKMKTYFCPADEFIGRKKTLQFYSRGHPSGVGSKTNWIMNVYSMVTDFFIADELVLCHVFEDDSPPYDRRPNCVISHGFSPMHHGPDQCSDPRLIAYIAELKNVLLGDPDTSTDTDNCNPIRDIPPIPDDGQSRKRKKNNRSVVWDYFTKIYAHNRKGQELKLAACNHCFKLLTANSTGGTAHLARHRCSCPCKLQPVAAGRNAQGDVNVLS